MSAAPSPASVMLHRGISELRGPAQVLQIQETDRFAGLDGLYIMGAIVYSIGEAALPSNSVWPTC